MLVQSTRCIDVTQPDNNEQRTFQTSVITLMHQNQSKMDLKGVLVVKVSIERPGWSVR
mgnify:CR=1 FL=1